jgi:dihydrofolate reductase
MIQKWNSSIRCQIRWSWPGRTSTEPPNSYAGRGTLVRFLLTEGLLDELQLLVHPVLAGTGKHLFEGGNDHVPLHLVQARPHSNGVVALRYTRAG